MMKPSSAEYQKILTDEDGEYGETTAYPVKNSRSRASPCSRCVKITVIILGLLLATSFCVACVGYHMAGRFVKRFTVTTPEAIPVVQVDRTVVEAAKGRAKGFYEDLIHGDVPEEDLVITETEINGLFGHSDFLRGNAKLSIEDNTVKLDVSLPVHCLPGGKGRFFVATATETLDTDNESLVLDIESHNDIKDYGFGHTLVLANIHWYMDRSNYLTAHLVKGIFFGHEAPQDYIDQHENLIGDLYDDEDASKIIRRIQGVKIEKGQIVIVPKRGTTEYDSLKPQKKQHTNFLRRVLVQN